jgi:Zn-dependent M32 family carboxypeptidase
MVQQSIDEYYKAKKERRKNKKFVKRHASGEEVIKIFEMVLNDKKSSQIINELKRNDPQSPIEKKYVNRIMTGNCKVNSEELPEDKYNYYCKLREEVYEYWRNKKSKEE